MSSHRNTPSFSRLRDMLASVPAASDQQSLTADSEIKTVERPPEALVVEDRQFEKSDSKIVITTPLELIARSALPAKPGKRKAMVKTATFRMPVDLLDALRAVADYNNLNQGDIVSEGLYLHLDNFAWPPGTDSEQLRNRLRQLL